MKFLRSYDAPNIEYYKKVDLKDLKELVDRQTGFWKKFKINRDFNQIAQLAGEVN